MRRVISTFLFVSMLASIALVGGPTSVAQTPSAGGVHTDNLEYVGFVPFDQSTSTGVTIHKGIMYLTSWKNISTYDVSDPINPVLLGQLPIGFMFENEQVAVHPQGKFILFSESLPGDALHVYDVEDPTNIIEIATLQGAGDHTMSCILKCTWGYGSDGTIVDLRDPTDPKLAAARGSEMSWHRTSGLQGGGHDVIEYKNGFVLTSPLSDALQTLDVRSPLKPKVLARGEKPGTGYLFHSGQWPREGEDKFVLMQGEDNFNPRCNQEANGPFLVYDTTGWQKTHTFRLTDQFAAQNGTFSDGNPPANGLGCSAHWFEHHPTFNNGGVVAMGYYEHGTRMFNITSKGKIQELGYFLPYSGSTSAANWASTSVKEDIIYAIDYVRGIDILRYIGDEIKVKKLRPRVKLTAKPFHPKRGQSVDFITRLAACARDGVNPKGTKVTLQQKDGSGWKSLETKKFSASCKVVYKRNADFDSATFRTVYPKQLKGYTKGRSAEMTLETS